jgi:hypothetical protein
MGEQGDGGGGSEALDILQVILSSFVRQTSSKFRFRPIQLHDCERRLLTIYSYQGITYIAANGVPQIPSTDPFTGEFTVPGDSDVPGDLQTLTDELKQFTAEVNDIQIAQFGLRWGVADGRLPCLISAKGAYDCNPEVAPFAAVLRDIVLFVALEIGQIAENGRCFTQRGDCAGFAQTIIRQKVEIWRIRRLARSLPVDDQTEFLFYVKKRLNQLCPSLMMSTVSVCRACFRTYSREKMPFRGPQPRSCAGTVTRSRDTESEIADVPTPTTSIVPPRPEPFRPVIFRRSGSGLTYVQDFSQRSQRKAHRTYLSTPFPAFLQHPV